MTRILPARLVLVAALAVAATPVPAQTAAPGGGDKPAHGCVKPEMPDSLTSDLRMRVLRRGLDEYRTCIKKYLDEQAEAMKKLQASANATIDEFNATMKEWNAAVSGESQGK
jgi:hypothetical protein